MTIEMNNGWALDLYKKLIDEGVAPEQARMVLPLSTYTEWYWTGSLMAFARVCNLRMSDDAQEETQEIARQISEHCAILFPVSWKYLVQYSEE
jgi:thymidylate synthase (FAD)